MNPFDSHSDTLIIRNIGDVYPVIGDGRYQFLIIIAGCIATIPIGMQEFMLVFLAFNPGWKCEVGSKTCLHNGTILPTDPMYKDRCTMNRTDWKYVDTKGFSIVNEFGLICGMDFWIYTSSSVFYLGNVIGALVSGWLSDKIGRTRVLMCSYIMVLVTGLVTSFLPNLWMFEVIRVMTGIFVPGTYMIMVVLSSEIVSEKWRPAAGIVYWMFYSGGVAVLGVKAFYLHSWRKLLVYGSVPYLITIILLSLLPESFVWLHVKEREEELKLAIKKIAKINGKVIPHTICIKPPPRITDDHRCSLFTLFAPLDRMMITFPMMFSWFAIGLIYFGESLAASNLTGNEYRDFVLLAVVDIPAAVIAIICAMRVGRKKTVLICILLSGSCISLVGLFKESQPGSKIYRLIFGVTAKLFCSVVFDTIVTWCTELYPTTLRSKANGLFNSCLIFGGMCAPWVSQYLHNVSSRAPFFAMGSCMVISFIILSHLRETKGKRLPQRSGTNLVVHNFDTENALELYSPHFHEDYGKHMFEYENEHERMRRTQAYIMNLERVSKCSSINSQSPQIQIRSAPGSVAEKPQHRPRVGTVVYKFGDKNTLEMCSASEIGYEQHIDLGKGDGKRSNVKVAAMKVLKQKVSGAVTTMNSPKLQIHSSASDVSRRRKPVIQRVGTDNSRSHPQSHDNVALDIGTDGEDEDQESFSKNSESHRNEVSNELKSCKSDSSLASSDQKSNSDINANESINQADDKEKCFSCLPNESSTNEKLDDCDVNKDDCEFNMGDCDFTVGESEFDMRENDVTSEICDATSKIAKGEVNADGVVESIIQGEFISEASVSHATEEVSASFEEDTTSANVDAVEE